MTTPRPPKPKSSRRPKRPKRPKPDASFIVTKADAKAVREGCWFDEAAASFAVDWIETFCRRTKGRKPSQRFKLLGWQRDLVRKLFGWKRPDGRRRFLTAYIEVAKKNGKSFLMSAIALFMAMADGEMSAEVYIAASNSKNARIIYDECVKMIHCSPALKRRLTVRDYVKKIEYRATASKIECVTVDAESQDGLDSSCTIFDELHRQKNSRLWDVFEFAGRGREQPLLLAITTAGSSKTSLCWSEHERARKIIDGDSLDTSHLAVIYSADRNDDLDDRRTWKKANPSLGETVSYEDFARDLAKVRESPSGLNNFLRLRLCIWAEAETSYISHDAWERCGLKPIDWTAFHGKTCYAGLDLSSKKDLTAFVMLFGDEVEGFTLFAHHWIPEVEAIQREATEGIPYREWARLGLVTIIPGPAIDYDVVEAEVVAMIAPFKVASVCVDEWGSSTAVAQRLANRRVKMVHMRQGFKSLSEPTKELERQALLGNLNHGGNPVLAWSNSHATVKSDPAGNIKLIKPSPKSPLKIDGLVSAVEAMYAHLLVKRAKPNAYSTGKIKVITL